MAIALVAAGLIASGCATQSSGTRPTLPPWSPKPTEATSPLPTTTAVVATTTTTITRRLDLDGLPLVTMSETDETTTRVVQRLLNAVCCDRLVDGDWGPKTQESLDDLRSTLGLTTGGVDKAFWEAFFAQQAFSNRGGSDLPHGLQLSSATIELASDEESFLAVFAGGHSLFRVRKMFDRVIDRSLSEVPWCGQINADGSTVLRWRTNQGSGVGQGISITITDMGGGRIDLLIRDTTPVRWSCQESNDVDDESSPSTTSPPRTATPPTTTTKPRVAVDHATVEALVEALESVDDYVMFLRSILLFDRASDDIAEFNERYGSTGAPQVALDDLADSLWFFVRMGAYLAESEAQSGLIDGALRDLWRIDLTAAPADYRSVRENATTWAEAWLELLYLHLRTVERYDGRQWLEEFLLIWRGAMYSETNSALLTHCAGVLDLAKQLDDRGLAQRLRAIC